MTSVRTRPSRVLPQRPRVAVVGATGAVGSTMLEVLAERSFPADEVVPFASERLGRAYARRGAAPKLILRRAHGRGPSRASTSRCSRPAPA